MNQRQEESGTTGILIAVVIGGILVVAILAVGFLFLGATRFSASTPIVAPAASAPATAPSSVPATPLEEPAPSLEAQGAEAPTEDR